MPLPPLQPTRCAYSGIGVFGQCLSGIEGLGFGVWGISGSFGDDRKADEISATMSGSKRT
jgi:hypothetical protein